LTSMLSHSKTQCRILAFFHYYTRMTFVRLIFNRFHFSKTKRLQDIEANIWLADTGFKSKNKTKTPVSSTVLTSCASVTQPSGDTDQATTRWQSLEFLRCRREGTGLGREWPVMSRCAVMSVGCGCGRSHCSL